MAVANHAARLGKHRSEFRVGECDGHDDRRTQHPGPDSPWPCKARGTPGAEQPARSDNRAQPSEHQGKGADLAPDRAGWTHAHFRSSVLYFPIMADGGPASNTPQARADRILAAGN